ncbi:HPr family phosphocarrier protein [Lysinibacillus parviboronicapiens]|uniref:Phosphocarrier protein HPr n=1 Tax=Lysinibacillus parviboronicapiens TaxID=436516 RepID=A0ABV2PNK8_9BACI|nr:HPr family phosphocarrier protein [Lysinibacillus parviboronicapiens]
MKKTFKITTPEGLHARPSALLVTAVTPFECDVLLTYNDKSVNLKSIMGVMALGILPGSIVAISAEGADADKLIQTVSDIMITKGIGEEC